MLFQYNKKIFSLFYKQRFSFGKKDYHLFCTKKNLLKKKNYYYSEYFQFSYHFPQSILKKKWFLVAAILGFPLSFFTFQSIKAEEKNEKINKENILIINNEEEEEEEEEEIKESTILHFKYVIIGAGTAGHSAVEQIKTIEPEEKILIIGDEPYNPYARPPLSKNLWSSDDPNVSKTLIFKDFEGNEKSIWYEGNYEEAAITFMKSRSVKDIDVYKKAILLDNDQIIRYDKCLIATGGKPKMIPGVDPQIQDKVSTFRTVDDFLHLEKLSKEINNITIIGGGFLGSELACGLAHRGKSTGLKVTQIYPESGLMALAFPKYLSDYTTQRVQNELGISMKPGRLVQSITKSNNNKVLLTLDNQETIETDHVVVAVGIKPSVDFAIEDLEINKNDGGIAVNAELMARSDIYAAGDVASYHDLYLGRRRVEHYDHAVASGRLAAKNMTGSREPYLHLPMFWSDLGSIGYEAVGIIDSNLNTIGIWELPKDQIEKEQEKHSIEKNQDNVNLEKKDYKRGIIYYLSKENKIVGVILWNVWGKIEDARRAIKLSTTIKDPNELKSLICLEDDEQHEEEKSEN